MAVYVLRGILSNLAILRYRPGRYDRHLWFLTGQYVHRLVISGFYNGHDEIKNVAPLILQRPDAGRTQVCGSAWPTRARVD